MKTIIPFLTMGLLSLTGTVHSQGDVDNNVAPANGINAITAPVVHEMKTTQEMASAPAVAGSGVASPSAIIKTEQVIDFGGQCRWFNDDIRVQFGVPNIPGFQLRDATINLRVSDVDFFDVSIWEEPEIDIVGIGNTFLSVGVLGGRNGEPYGAAYNAVDQLQKNLQSGALDFQINIDALHDNMH